jgi:hypothetical protein
MIKLSATKGDGGKVLFLGLSRRNIELLTAGRPIRVIGKEVGCDHDIFIHFGETEAAMVKELIAAGIRLPETVLTHDDDERQEAPPHKQ